MATVLLIDDQQSLRMLCKASLQGAGYHVLTAEHGKHGLRLLEHVQVDVIVVDLFMPEMDGLEFIPRVRGMQLGSRIIAMSGEAGYLGMAKQLGADDTIARPFGVQELVATVSSHLN